MSGEDTIWDKVNYGKKAFAALCGIAVIVTSVVTFLRQFAGAHIFTLIRAIWNMLFGTVIIVLQLPFEAAITTIVAKFGFLAGWFGRGMFYLFVGTNIITPLNDDEDPPWWMYLVGGCTLGIGCLELMFGFKCVKTTEPEPTAEVPAAGGGGKKGGFFKMFGGKDSGVGTNAVEPTFSVNVTQSQAVAAAGVAASAAKSVGPGVVAQAAGAAGQSQGANPFFGNSHLANQ